ncbi:LacI family DNA-binding transcriptional regulator [Pseudactinotalea terrae]|uniref:LacI family DNA-binding transcriptional regulator n=1 Tax=Pseudactinotalea terrae TaxID=1743262 RepID=UPI0012E2C137|nr:LacI family DNA-binding transcriptional regulator [Pseudactinotalea terrae]
MEKMLARERREQLARRVDSLGSVRTSAVASELQVSLKTVQRDLQVLAERGRVVCVHGGAVSPHRVRVPTPAAPEVRTLRLGLILPNDDCYYNEVLKGVEEAAALVNATVVVGMHGYSDDVEETLLRRLSALELDGILITNQQSHRGYATLMGVQTPIVLIERPIFPHRMLDGSDPILSDVDRVYSDHYAGALLGLDHLFGLGHRSVHFLMKQTPTAIGLLRGVRDTQEADQSPSDAPRWGRVHVHDLGPPTPPIPEELIATTMAAMGEDLYSGEATALFVHSDLEAGMLHTALTQRGFDVPGTISLLSYDDVLTPDELLPLSAVSPRRRWIGRMACETLVNRLRRDAGPARGSRPVNHVTLIPELRLRGTTAPPPSGSLSSERVESGHFTTPDLGPF